MKGAVLRRQMVHQGGPKQKLPGNFRFFHNDQNDQEDSDLITTRREFQEKSIMHSALEQENIEDGRETKASYDNLKMVESHSALMSLIGMGLTVMQYDLEFDDVDYELSQIMLYLIFVSSLFLVVLTACRYKRRVDFMIVRKTFPKGSNLINTGYWKWMVAEMVFVFIHPSPFLYRVRINGAENEFQFFSIYYFVNDFLGGILIFRVFLVIRSLFRYSFWTSNRSQRLCKMYDTSASITFALRSFMRMHPFVVAFGLYLSSVPILAYLIRVCELPNVRTTEVEITWSFRAFADAMWDIVITIGTIGFGDYSPQTFPGRVLTFFICIWGSSVTSLIVVATNQKIDMTNSESKIYQLLKRLKIREHMKSESAFIMTNMAKAKFAKNAGKSSKRFQHKVAEHLQRFRKQNREYKELAELANDQERMLEQMGWLRSEMVELIYYTKQLKSTTKIFMNVLGVDQRVAEMMGSDAEYVKNSMKKSLKKYSASFCGGGAPEFEQGQKHLPF